MSRTTTTGVPPASAVKNDPGSATFVFRGGATAVLDHQGGVRYLIGKGIDDQARLRRQREYLREVAGRGPAAAYRGALVRPLQLSALHRGFDA